tara:strand:- start:15 stop:629 length:615 start_codon:yes stop_codon:yes gene_type:complete
MERRELTNRPANDAVGVLDRGRAIIPFRAVNRRDAAGFRPGMQRHHLLPCQLLSRGCFASLFETLGKRRLFDDFRANGLLLPANEANALRTAMPLHRGPHRTYSDMVVHRVGQIEAGWRAKGGPGEDKACLDALMRLELLQAALRRRLLDHKRRHVMLSHKDPIGQGVDFTELDAMAEMLWSGTGIVTRPPEAIPAQLRLRRKG